MSTNDAFAFLRDSQVGNCCKLEFNWNLIKQNKKRVILHL